MYVFSVQTAFSMYLMKFFSSLIFLQFHIKINTVSDVGKKTRQYKDQYWLAVYGIIML